MSRDFTDRNLAKQVTDIALRNIPEHLRAAPAAPPGVDATLAERHATYGDFAMQARITQRLKDAMHDVDGWITLPDDMSEALEMIASKIARILNGDPTHIDSWHDIEGYARLITKRLTKEQV